MRRVSKISAIAAIGISAAIVPLMASAATSPSTAKVEACVKYGPKGGTNATGNYVLYNWNKSACPAGSYAVSWDSQGATGATGATGPAGPSGVTSTVTKDFGGVASVPTGGSFVTNATGVGEITLGAGTYELSLAAKATPTMTSAVQVFPVFAVYNQAANASFTGDLFNVGSGALESGGQTNIDSYYDGSSTVTLDATTTLHIYAFGYDSDRSAGGYALDDVTVTATAISVDS
jgi:hypothetical protein